MIYMWILLFLIIWTAMGCSWFWRCLGRKHKRETRWERIVGTVMLPPIWAIVYLILGIQWAARIFRRKEV